MNNIVFRILRSHSSMAVISLFLLSSCVQNLGKRDSNGNPLPLIPASVGKERIERVKQVQPGMTLEQAQNVVGAPADRQTRGNQEVWLYCQTGITDYSGKLAVIWFRDGRVTETNSRVQAGAAKPCRFSFYPVRWNDVGQTR